MPDPIAWWWEDKTGCVHLTMDRPDVHKAAQEMFCEPQPLYGKLPEALVEGDLRKALGKINDIRNSIIGFQTVNWSEHIYPLVAALNEAGIKGANYPEARANVGTMLERTLAAENEAARLRAALSEIATDEEYRDLTAEEAKKVARAALSATAKEGE